MNAPVMTYEETRERLADLSGDLGRLGVAELALFGSVLRGTAEPDSDIDLLVRFAPGTKTYDRFIELCELLETRLGRRADLVTTEALSPYLGPRILEEARDVLRAA